MMPASASAARTIGAAHFFTGVPCPSGHVARRLASSGQCLACDRAKSATYRATNSARARAASAAYDARNREARRQAAAARRAANPDKYREQVRRHQSNHRQRVLARRGELERARKAADPLYRLQRHLRRRMAKVIANAGYTKRSRTGDLLGCDWPTLKAHIEERFAPGMTWENRSEWHIDHERPLSKAKNESDLVARFHYSNLQPLWALDNMRKGAREVTA